MQETKLTIKLRANGAEKAQNAKLILHTNMRLRHVCLYGVFS